MSFAGYLDAGQPNNTLYVQNLNERVALKHLIPQLKETFSEYGEVVDVVAKRRLALRGQAFIIYRDVESARKALEGLQSVRIYGKTVNVRFAKYKSDVISKADGTFEIERRRREQDKIERAKQPRLTRRQIMAQMAANPAVMHMHPSMSMPSMAGSMMINPQMGSGDLQLPNKVLYLQQLPTDAAKEEKLQEIFKRFPGFVEVRLVPNRPDVAFVEYENEMQASAARQSTDGIEMSPGDDNTRIRVTFARR